MTSINLDFFEKFPVIETRRLLMREFRLEDAEAIMAMRNNPRVGEFILRSPMKEAKDAQDLIEKIQKSYADKQNIGWAGVDKETGRFIGGCGFNHIDFDNNRAEIGGEMVVDYWGQKLAIEAVQELIKYGLETMNLHSIEARLWPENRSAVYLLEQMGFVKEAHFKDRLFDPRSESYRDIAVYTRHA